MSFESAVSIERMDSVVSERSIRRWEDLDSDCLANVFARVGMESLVLDVSFVCKSWEFNISHSPSCWQVLSFPPLEPSPVLLIDSYNNTDDTDTFETFGPFYDKFVEVYGIDRPRFSITGFIKLIVSRSKGMTRKLYLPQYCTEEAYRCVAEDCPLVHFVSFSDDLLLFPHSRVISQVIGKWEYLMDLSLGGNMIKISGQKFSSSSDFSKHFMAVLEGVDPSTMRLKRLYDILVEIGKSCKHFSSLRISDVEVGKLRHWQL